MDAINLQNAGVFSIVLEGIPWQIAKLVTSTIDIPTIGIGAGQYCDGQIIIIYDMLGIFTEFKPKFVKHFGKVGKNIRNALNAYKNEIIGSKYPDLDHSYSYPTEDLSEINEWFENADLNEEAAKLKKDLI